MFLDKHAVNFVAVRLVIYGGFDLNSRADGKKTPEPVFKNARIGSLFTKWRHVWLMAMERRRKLQDALDRLNEVSRGLVQLMVYSKFKI